MKQINSINIYSTFYTISFKILTDKVTSVKEIAPNQQVRTVADKVQKRQDIVSGAGMVSTHNIVPPIPKIPINKMDATDRRQIEAQNEDKCQSTKETLNDIKRVHQKEKKKKEKNNIERCQTGNDSKGLVS